MPQTPPGTFTHDSGVDSIESTILTAFGLPLAPPAPPTAPATFSPTTPIVSSSPTPGQGVATDPHGRLPVTIPVQSVVFTTEDPTNPVIGQMWYRQDTSQFCIRHDASTTKRVTLT